MRTLRLLLFVYLIISIVGAVSFADVPHFIMYQGRLTDDEGVAVPDHDYEMRFAIYHVATGGTPEWTSGVRSVPVVDGLFSYRVPVPPEFLTTDANVYLSVTVFGEELIRRTRLVSVPYAYVAESGGGWTDGGSTVTLTEAADNVGVGTANPSAKLEVSYIMRLTPTDAPDPCDENLLGGIYFDQILKEPCYCNGIYWTQFDGGGPCSGQCFDLDLDTYDICDASHPSDTDGLPADCDDQDGLIYPGAPETWYDGVDQNCDGQSDYDQDQDGFDHDGYGGNDCDDLDASVNPGADEICDGDDNNCNGQTDETGCSVPAVGELIITEMMVNPDDLPDAEGEWFEVYNPTGSTFNLQGLIIDNPSGTHTITQSVAIGPLQLVVLANGAFPGFTPHYVYSGVLLSNIADVLRLRTATTTIDQVLYDGALGFPLSPGVSMELSIADTDHELNDIGSNWCEAITVYYASDRGTPGQPNDCP